MAGRPTFDAVSFLPPQPAFPLDDLVELPRLLGRLRRVRAIDDLRRGGLAACLRAAGEQDGDVQAVVVATRNARQVESIRKLHQALVRALYRPEDGLDLVAVDHEIMGRIAVDQHLEG